MTEVSEPDPAWEVNEHGHHILAFGDMRACITFVPGTMIIEIVVDAEPGDGPQIVFDYIAQGTPKVDDARAHAVKMARTWLQANLAELDRVHGQG